MALSISKKKLIIRCLTSYNHYSNTCTFSVRRNASSASPEQRPLLSDASSISFSELSKQEAAQQKKTAAIKALFKEYGFADAHISRLESRIPSIFHLSPEKNLSLKFKFLESIGLSTEEIPKLVLNCPYFMSSSLEKTLVPCYNYLKNSTSISGEQLNQMLIIRPHIITKNLDAAIAPNVELLRSMGVPLSFITYSDHYRALSCNHVLYKSSVDEAIKIGLNPLKKAFIVAVSVLLCRNSKQTWERKMKVYRGFGLSDDEILLGFRNQPTIMALSEKKIARGLEFFLREKSWCPATLASNPVVLLLSLERRVIPRFQVIEILKEKDLLDIAPLSFLMISEEKFMNKYIHSHEDVSSELMEIYKRHDGSSSQSKTS